MKKTLSVFLSLIMILCAGAGVNISAAAAETKITSASGLTDAFNKGGEYILSTPNIFFSSTPINKSIKLNGAGNSISGTSKGASASFYQNENVSSEFKALTVEGNTKQEVGIWLGAGTMSFTDCSINAFNITSVRYSAVAAGGSSSLVLNNTTFSGNSVYDVYLTDSASVRIEGSTSLGKLDVASSFAKINIADNWSGSFSLTFENPVAKVIGTVSENADISGISVTNEGYFLAKENGKLVLKAEGSKEIHFDMSKREELYKGSTGFLYGAAEINVPSIDLLYGLKPDTMVQKAYGGLQHPTGDAVRTSSALINAGVRDMQIYLQDHYLEWPYDAPMKNGTIDLDEYQKVVESIIYGMICDEASEGDSDAFKGSDGKYYILNTNKDKYSYVLFNEPDQIWYGGNLEGLKNAWLKIYKAVHNIDPNARCVGPNFSGFNAESYASFIEFCYNNNCLPEIISWHELGDISLTDYYAHYEAVKSLQSKYYTDEYAEKSGRSYQPQLMVNEYARHYDIGAPGGLVKWLSMFEDKDMSGCMAYWAMANTLNEMAADQNSPTSTWWVYHWYAEMTGKQCPLYSPSFEKSRFYGLASYDEDINTGYVLFGGNEDENSGENVYLDNISSTGLANNDAVHVRLYGVSFSGQLGASYKPKTVFDNNVKVSGDALQLSVHDTDEMEAYFAVLTPASDGAQTVGMGAAKYPATSYEAEEAELLGGATAYSKGGWATFATSGRADVGNINNIGDGVSFTVNVDESGYYNASLFYSLQAPYVNPKTLEPDSNGQNRGIGKALPYGILLDGKELDNILLESTVTWWYKNHCDTKLYLSAGEHNITYKHINSNDADKGNLQLVAALDKLEISKAENSENDFIIYLNEMSNFKTADGYKVTAIAPEEGYYSVFADGDVSLSRQCADYAADAKSKSVCSVFDCETGDTLYLSKGANTLTVKTNATALVFNYEENKTSSAGAVISSADFTLHGNSPSLKPNPYANSKRVVSELGIGQSPSRTDSGEYNYMTFSVEAESEGIYNFAIRYSNDEPAPIMLKSDGSTYIHPYNIDLVERYAQIKVNDAEPETVYFKNTLSWDTFKTLSVQLKLNKGRNTVKIYNDNSYQFSPLVNSTAPEIDTITVSKLSYDSSSVKLIKGSDSVKHDYDIKTSVTKATTSSNGKLEKYCQCKECGYAYTETQIISKPSSVKLSAASYTYNKKAKKPAVSITDSSGKAIPGSSYTLKYSNNVNVGTAKVSVTFKGNYSGTLTKTYKIVPPSTSLSKLTSGKKLFKVKWKKQSAQTTGYEIQYSLKSSFKGAKTVNIKNNKTTSATLKKLTSKKKYYVRVRTYKTVGGKKYCSPWSKAKSIKVK